MRLFADVGGDGLRVGWVESRHLPGPCSPTGRWRLVRIWLVVDKLMTISGFVEGCLVRKISRIGPQKGLKNAKWKENSRGRKIMRFRTEKGKETFQNKVFYFEKEKENGKEENVLGNQGKG